MFDLTVRRETMLQMVEQTVGPNAILAEGVPPYGWQTGGQIEAGNNPGSQTQINPWGVIYRADGNPPDPDVAIKVGNLELLVLYGGVWKRVQRGARVLGELFEATFDGYDTGTHVTLPAAVHSVAPDFVITDIPVEDFCFHFYLPRKPIAGTIGGIIVSFEAKIISKSGADVSAHVGEYLAQSGCDFKNSDGTGINGSWIGQMVPLTTSMRRYYGTTLSPAELRAFPPAFRLEQLTQIDAPGVDPDYVP